MYRHKNKLTLSQLNCVTCKISFFKMIRPPVEITTQDCDQMSLSKPALNGTEMTKVCPSQKMIRRRDITHDVLIANIMFIPKTQLMMPCMPEAPIPPTTKLIC